jgi:hypothetical protein
MGKPREIAAFALFMADESRVTRALLGRLWRKFKNFGKSWAPLVGPDHPYI